MTLKEDILEFVVDEFRWRIVITLDFIADDFHFLVDLLLWILAMEDDIRQYVHGLGEVLLRDGSIEGSVFLVGKCVEFTTQTLQSIDDLKGIAFFRSLEGHVLAEMGHALLTRTLIARSCSYLIATVDHPRSRWQMDDSQAVWEGMSVVFCHFARKGTNFFLFLILNSYFICIFAPSIIKQCEK